MLGWSLSKIMACKRKYILPWVNTNTNNISIGDSVRLRERHGEDERGPLDSRDLRYSHGCQ
jgi:hypothetical protein